MLQTPSINLCACVRVRLTVWWTHEQHCLSGTGSPWKIYVNAVLLLVSIFTNFLPQLIPFIYIFASNYTQWAIEPLLLVQPTLCLANTLWYKHATLTYSSLAYWGCVFFCLCLFMLFIFYKPICRWWSDICSTDDDDVSIKDEMILNNTACFFIPHMTLMSIDKRPGFNFNATPPKICQNADWVCLHSQMDCNVWSLLTF